MKEINIDDINIRRDIWIYYEIQYDVYFLDLQCHILCCFLSSSSSLAFSHQQKTCELER